MSPVKKTVSKPVAKKTVTVKTTAKPAAKKFSTCKTTSKAAVKKTTVSTVKVLKFQ